MPMYWKWGIAVEQRGLSGPEATNYESVVRMELGWIEATDVGHLLLWAIAREVLKAPPNQLATFHGTPQPGQLTRGVLVQPYIGGQCDAQEGNAIVYFSPYSALGPCWELLLRVNRNRGLYPQEILFHELVHAFRDASGFGQDLNPLQGGLAGYGDPEEFIAILVSNIFMTDPSNTRSDRLGLRKDWKGSHKLAPGLSGSFEFFQSSWDTFDLVDQFCQENPWFTKKLAEINASFNPIAAYYHDSDKARDNSRSVSAINRDLSH
jgi:hypothetical protein